VVRAGTSRTHLFLHSHIEHSILSQLESICPRPSVCIRRVRCFVMFLAAIVTLGDDPRDACPRWREGIGVNESGLDQPPHLAVPRAFS
jgi:hypothetical protein